MFFSKKKKTLRDRKAGLVFRWRGGHASNRGGGTMALLLTSAVFAGGFLLFNVYAKPNTVSSRHRASIIQLSEIDDRLEWWIEKNSPAFPQWSMSDDEQSMFKVDSLLVRKINASQHKSSGYQDIEIAPIEVVGNEMYSLNSNTLPPIDRLTERLEKATSEPNNVPKVAKWSLEIKVSGGLSGRLLDDVIYGDWIPQTWRGGSMRFSVAVDAKGKVLTVNPVDWSESDVVEKLETWLYTLTFKPLKKQSADSSDTVIGVVALRSVSEIIPVEQIKKNEDEVKEEKP